MQDGCVTYLCHLQMPPAMQKLYAVSVRACASHQQKPSAEDVGINWSKPAEQMAGKRRLAYHLVMKWMPDAPVWQDKSPSLNLKQCNPFDTASDISILLLNIPAWHFVLNSDCSGYCSSKYLDMSQDSNNRLSPTSSTGTCAPPSRLGPPLARVFEGCRHSLTMPSYRITLSEGLINSFWLYRQGTVSYLTPL